MDGFKIRVGVPGGKQGGRRNMETFFRIHQQLIPRQCQMHAAVDHNVIGCEAAFAVINVSLHQRPARGRNLYGRAVSIFHFLSVMANAHTAGTRPVDRFHHHRIVKMGKISAFNLGRDIIAGHARHIVP